MKSKLILTADKLQISNYLKDRRKSLDLTQADLAKYCNLSREGVQKIESGQSDIQLKTLVKLSKILGFKIAIETEDE